MTSSTRRAAVLSLRAADPTMSKADIAARLGITVAGVNYHLRMAGQERARARRQSGHARTSYAEKLGLELTQRLAVLDAERAAIVAARRALRLDRAPS